MDRPGRCELEVGSTIEKKPLPIICLKVLNDPKLILLDHLKDHSEPLGVKNKKLVENSFSLLLVYNKPESFQPLKASQNFQ